MKSLTNHKNSVNFIVPGVQMSSASYNRPINNKRGLLLYITVVLIATTHEAAKC